MNIPVGIWEIDRILGGESATPVLSDSIVLGMPHLCLGGLSETWLLKECGHRHWILLAHATGNPVPDFRDADGDPVYAAFVAVTLRGGELDAASEHDELDFTSRLTRVSHTRFMSVHRIALRGRPIGELVLTSVFVKRMNPGLNRSIARVEISGLPPVGVAADLADDIAVVAALRRGHWTEHLGFLRADAAELDRLAIDPCPAQDFNGADFLYFSSFQAFVDRAEWAFLPRGNPSSTTRRRDIVYHGNVEPGDRIAVVLRAVQRGEGWFGHWCRIERDADVAPLADIFTIRHI